MSTKCPKHQKQNAKKQGDFSFVFLQTKRKKKSRLKKKKKVLRLFMSHASLLASKFHKRVTHPCCFAAFHKCAEHTFCFYFLDNETAWFCHNRRHQAEYQPCVTGLFSAEYREKMGVFRAMVAPSRTSIGDQIDSNSLGFSILDKTDLVNSTTSDELMWTLNKTKAALYFCQT